MKSIWLAVEIVIWSGDVNTIKTGCSLIMFLVMLVIIFIISCVFDVGFSN